MNSSSSQFSQTPATVLAAMIAAATGLASEPVQGTVAQEPLTVARAVRPIVMLALSNDHQLYLKAYDDQTDIDGKLPGGDPELELTYENSYTY